MSRTVLFLIIFLAICLQMLITVFQVKDYRKALKEVVGKGLVGVGHTKGIIHKGQILLLQYDPKTDQVTNCMVMRGLTIFARFKQCDSYTGMTLDQVREIALKEDAKAFRYRRKRHPYDPEELTKKKHALIQAVEAIDRRLKTEKEEEIKKIRIQRLKEKSRAKTIEEAA